MLIIVNILSQTLALAFISIIYFKKNLSKFKKYYIDLYIQLLNSYLKKP